LLRRLQRVGAKSRSEGRKEKWWLFGRSNDEMRNSIAGLARYVATPEVARHRPFVFIAAETISDASIYCAALEDAWLLGVLSSRIHKLWSLRAGGRLGVGNDPRYFVSRCFDPFPFPDSDDKLKAEIRAVAEELDAFRKERQRERPADDHRAHRAVA
jgi:type II restriction/modification system DNA methylase subunit YeeA